MALTLSGTNGVVGAGFTLDASGASVTAGVGTFGSIRGDHHGDGANLTSIPAANIVGLATAGFERTGGFGGGKVLQVVPVNFNTSATTTSGSFVSTGLSASITLTANNYVLVRAHGGAANNSAGYGSYYTIYRGTSNIAPHGTEMGSHYGEDNSNNIVTTVYMEVRDTPGTGTHTYSVEHKVWGGGTSVFGKNTTGAMILMEIEA